MLSYAHGACADPLLGETIGHNLARTIARVPDAEALVDCGHGVRYTYAELGEAVDRLAGGMLAAGLRKGDRVGVWSPNRAEWALTQYATARAGVILVNINPAYRVSELQYALDAIGLPLDPRRPAPEGLRLRRDGRPRPPGPARARARDLLRHARLGGARIGIWLHRRPRRATADELDFDDPINIQYTSGTTGFPKGATLTHHNILNNGYFVGELLDYTERDRVCIPVPLYHCFGMVLGNLAATSHGACMVYPAETFEPAATLEACAQERCTSLYGVPTMFIAELAHERFSEFDLELAAHRDHGRARRARSR